MSLQVFNNTYFVSAGHIPGVGTKGYRKQKIDKNLCSPEMYILVFIVMIYYRVICSVQHQETEQSVAIFGGSSAQNL